MPSQIPFTAVIKESISANGSVEYNYKAPNGQDFRIHRIFFIAAAAFSLTRMQDDAGRQYGQMSSNDPIPSTELPTSNTDINSVNLTRVPLLLKAGATITLELLDTSGGTNASTVILEGEMTVP